MRDQFTDMKIVGVAFAPPWKVVDCRFARAWRRYAGSAVDPDDDAVFFGTSGTTAPKGAQLTHRGCVLNIMNVAFMNLCASTALARANGTEPIDPANAPVTVTLVTTPLFHVTANNCVAFATLTGGKIITCINGMLARR